MEKVIAGLSFSLRTLRSPRALDTEAVLLLLGQFLISRQSNCPLGGHYAIRASCRLCVSPGPQSQRHGRVTGQFALPRRLDVDYLETQVPLGRVRVLASVRPCVFVVPAWSPARVVHFTWRRPLYFIIVVGGARRNVFICARWLVSIVCFTGRTSARVSR